MMLQALFLLLQLYKNQIPIVVKSNRKKIWSEKFFKEPWLVWLSGLSAGLRTRASPAWIPDQGTGLGCGPGPQ